MQATVDTNVIASWWQARPEANVILVTGRVFDVLDVPAAAGSAALARMEAAGAAVGPVSSLGQDRMLFYVVTRGSPADEDEWWSSGLDCEPESVTPGLRWHCRDSYVLAPPSVYAAGPVRALASLAARASAARRAAAAGVPGRRLRGIMSEPEGRGATWTEERSDEGRWRPESAPEASRRQSVSP